MKRIIALITMIMMLALMTGCSAAEFKVEGEETAQKVYTYPNDNMFGLEKMVLFDDHAVAVFDIDKCDAGYVPIENLYKNNECRFTLFTENLKKGKIMDGSLEKTQGRYILTARESFDEADRINTGLPVKVTGLSFGNGMITCKEEKTSLQYTLVDTEYTEIACQEFNNKTGTWSEIKSDNIPEIATSPDNQ